MSHKLIWAASLLSVPLGALAFEAPIKDTDYTRQLCSGMYSSDSTYINVTFDQGSQGQLAMVIYEWGDYKYLGKVTSEEEEWLPQRTYVCTSDAVKQGFCSQSDVGRFILDLPENTAVSDTSFWSARVAFPGSSSASSNVATKDGEDLASSSGFWDNPEGNPTPPDSEYASPFRRDLSTRQALNPSPTGLFEYKEPIQYLVRKTGYYCVAIVPVTVLPSSKRQDDNPDPDSQTEAHPHYSGTVLFKNKFDGRLAATDYPKVNFYTTMLFVYLAFAGVWGWSCWKHRDELLPIQYYLSGLVGFLVIEMLANLTYYRYLNAHGKGTTSTVFLFVVAILDAGRNSLSFFLLLVVSLGLSVIREDLGSTMRKCQILAGFHFVFGVLYAVGIVELEFESTSALVLLLFVIPLAFTLSGFLMWTLYSLNATITQLKARKQHFKLRMFQRLQWILAFVVIVITIFFFVSSLTFSGRLAEDYAANSWKMRWWLLDGWLSLLYFISFAAVCYIWRPTPYNSRLLMSEELAQDEEDAEDYDLEAMESRTEQRHRDREDDEATLVGGRAGHSQLADDAVVFEIGDEDAHDLSDEEDDAAKRQRRRSSGHEDDDEHDERAGLMDGGKKDD
ncbi:unnamed protein product [Peniophora sp. CBMAI 1063]|nr:unnamed protein product [Peniophora sp. CBMAI 1063]